MPRSRGAVTGVLLILLGVAAALAPLLGPEIGLTIGSDKTWDLTQDRLFLSVIPGAAAAIGGLLLVVAANRPVAMFGGLLALAGGIWLVVGPVVSRLWEDSGGLLGAAGRPDGDRTRQTIEVLTYHHGIGALITALAGIGLGRLAVKAASEHRRDHDHVDRDRERPRATPAPAPVPAPRREERVVEEPTRREPVAEERVVEEPTRREPVAEERVVEEPRHREPILDEPTHREPILDEPTHREPILEEPRHREPVAEERVVEEPSRREAEPVAAEPATQVVEPAPEPRTEVRPPDGPSSPPARKGGIVGKMRDRFS